ncbi:MAG: hypothetical protein ACK5IJ_04810 [Mangrovibacterium sp.]
MIKIIFLIIVFFVTYSLKNRRKAAGGNRGSLLDELFPSEVQREGTMRTEVSEAVQQAEQRAKMVRTESNQPAPPKIRTGKSERGQSSYSSSERLASKDVVRSGSTPMQVEKLEREAFVFDLRKAVVYTEIMNPKFKE